MKLTPCRSCLGLLALASAAHASDLTLDGTTAAEVPYGGAFQIELSGSPGLPAFVFVDVSPGPTFLFGESIPLGFTPALQPIVSGTTGGAGLFTSPFFLAENPSHAGITLYLAGVILDGADPNGLDVSNGASLAIVPKVGAGLPQSTLVGRETTLDGSGAALADGTLAPGTAVAWSLVAQPPGSGATLTDPFGLTPRFVPDLPGDYSFEVAVSKSGSVATDQTTVHAYRIDLVPSLDGAYVVTPFASVQGTVLGPDLPQLTLNGASLFLSAFGDFGPVNESFPAGEVFLPLEFEIENNVDGSRTRERFTVAQGIPPPLSFPSVRSLEARLNPAGYDLVEAAAETELASTDIESLLLAGGPVQLAYDEGLFGFVIFSATVEFESLTYSSVDVQLSPSAAGVDGVVSIFDVDADFDVYGKLLEIPYDIPGDLQSNPAEITGTLALAPAPGGTLDATLQNLAVDLKSFSFDLSGFLGSVAELFIIESGVKAEVESAVADAVSAQFPPAIEEILSSFVLAGNLFDTLEVDVDLSAGITGVQSSTAGTTIQLDGSAAIGSSEPGSPAVAHYRTTPTAPPVFGPTTPGGATYGAGLALADDFLNQVLAAATGAGLLDGDMTELFATTPGGGDVFFSHILAGLFPGAGFEKFPSGTPVGLRSHGTMPPVVRTTPGGPTLGRIDVSDLEAVFRVDSPSGAIPVLRLSIDASAELDLTIGAAGELTAILGESTVSAASLQGFPGANLDVLDQGIAFLEAVLVPQLTELFAGIPLPSLEAQGIGLNPSEVVLIGGGAEYVGFFGDLVILPPGL